MQGTQVGQVCLVERRKIRVQRTLPPYEWADFKALVPELPLDDFFTEVIGQTPDKVIVPEERYWKEFAPTFYSAANWETLQAALKLGAASFWTLFLTDEIRVLVGEYSRAISGIPEPRPKEKGAYYWQKDIQPGAWTLVCR